VREGALGYINSEELYKQVHWLPLPSLDRPIRKSGPVPKKKKKVQNKTQKKKWKSLIVFLR
jgi:hypothetical protein